MYSLNPRVSRDKDAPEIKFIVNGDARARDFLGLNRANFNIFNWLKDYKMTMDLIRGSAIVVIDSYLAPKSFYAKISV